MATGLFFFDLYRSNLSIERNNSTNLPKNSNQIYSETLGQMFKGSKWENYILDGGDKRQLITFNVSSDYKVIVKRKATFCNITNEKIDEEDKLIINDPDIQEFLNEGLKEYSISKLMSSHPAGVNCYDFKITKLVQNNLLVYEFMMDYAGDNLEDYLLIKKKPKDFNGLHSFIEIINILKFI